jgi:hypothetical protein
MNLTNHEPVRERTDWYVSVPRGQVVTTNDHRPAPWGVSHARQVGAMLTACGLLAVEWPILWESPFDPRLQSSCPECAQHIREWSYAVPMGGQRELAPR